MRPTPARLAGRRHAMAAQRAVAEDVQLLLPGRLVEEALAQDDQQLCLDEVCAPNAGSADYELQTPQFKVEHAAPSLPSALLDQADAAFTRQGVLPEIRHMWRSFDSRLVLWRYADPRAPEVTEYCGVTQQIVAVATVRPKDFVSGVDCFLAISTPVEVSLHAVRFAPGSDRLLPLARTPFEVATDDTVVGAIACDNKTGRIFLGGSDGCVHEFQYFDDEARWFGRSKRSRKSVVSWTFQSRLPALLRRVSEALFGPADGIHQLAIDGDRGLLFSLSSQSFIAVFQIPGSGSQAQAGGGTSGKDGPLVHLCSISPHSLASSVSRIRGQLFPGLLPASSVRASVLEAGMHAVGHCHHPRLVKLLPLGRPQGGNIVVCVVAEDGTRIFLRGVFRSSGSMMGAPLGMPSPPPDGGNAASSRGPPVMTSLVVHHARFLDVNCTGLCVRDAIDGDGITLLLARLKPEGSIKRFTARPWDRADGGVSAGEASEGDVVVAVSADLRAVAQRQSRGRSPWLSAPMGLAEHAGVVPLDGANGPCQVMALAAFSGRLPQPLQALYSAGPASGAVSPVLGLSELARQQLLPPPRFLLVSSLGVHTLTKIQPVDVLRQRLLAGDAPLLRDFSQQYTAEQTCALCFQLLTAAVWRPDDPAGARTLAASPPRPDGSAVPVQARGNDQQRLAAGMLPHQWRDPDEERLLLHAERLLLMPQLAAEMGFVQAWPSAVGGSRGVAGQPQAAALGHALQLREANRISGRLRGLCLYLSRILRPLWLAPVMTVTWPSRTSDSGRKRRRDEWWPPPPEPPPEVHGAQWRCTWSKAQRSFIHGQLSRLVTMLEQLKGKLGADGPTGKAAAPADGAPAEGQLVADVTLLVATAMQALAFLELVAARTEVLSEAKCAPEALVRFAELTFRDLVCQPQARKVLHQLMRGGVVACRQLHAKCPQLFSVVDLEVQEAFELLIAVQGSLRTFRSAGVVGSTLDMANLSHVVQNSLRCLESHAAKVDLEEAATVLRGVGACRGLVSLCTRIARARDPRDESLHLQDPTSARAQQLHYARMECYQVVLEVLEDLMARVRQDQVDMGSSVVGSAPALLGIGSPGVSPGGPVSGSPQGRFLAEVPEILAMPLAEADAVPLLDALLRHCLEGKPYLADELFHFCVLKWMLQRGLPVYRYNSPYLKRFLERHGRDQPELLCRYFQHRGRWAEACDAYLALVRGSGRPDGLPPPLEERRVLLQSAALCARMPGSNRQAEPILRAMQELSEVKEVESPDGARWIRY
uniref:Nucleoporin Nup133/Nup155-like N-terminal domain-containing protein n=1 Tax=Alexandrium monilatum TaxID=311494 RepID=A0A7S4PT23_9DINO